MKFLSILVVVSALSTTTTSANRKRNKKSSSSPTSAPSTPLSLERLTGTWNICEGRTTTLINSSPEAEFIVSPTTQCVSNVLNITALNEDLTSFKLEYSLRGLCSTFEVTGTKDCLENNSTLYKFVYIGTQSLNPRLKDQRINFQGARVEYKADNGEFLPAPGGKEFGTVVIDVTTLFQQTIYTDWNIRDLFQDPKREVFKVRTWKLVKDLGADCDTCPTSLSLGFPQPFYN